MATTPFIQVIVPLRLEWEPCYRLDNARVGERVEVDFAHKGYVGVVSAVDVDPPTDPERILEARRSALPAAEAEEIAFWRAVADYYLCSVGEVYKAAYPVLKSEGDATRVRTRERLKERLKVLEEKISKARKEETRLRYQEESRRISALLNGIRHKGTPGRVALSPAQEDAATGIREAFSKGKTALLHGVTGSGKTEIYLQLASETLAAGRSVLYLVPEIALSQQLEERIATVFPDVLVYHSSRSQAKRREVADALREGAPEIVLGTRSALFLPHRNLGLVIVDEEHDSSYKQDSPAPRYQARESAIMLAGIHGAHVVLGSATPSLESLYNAENGIYIKVDLKERFYKGEEAEIQIIDTIAERRKRGMVGHLSLKLLEEIRRTMDAGRQALLLRSRRSYAPSVQCAECGTIPKCPHCHVSLSLHKGPDRLVCHYCGHTEPFTGACGKCGGELQPLGAGTQKIEEELHEVFPDARIARVDSDNSAEATATLRSFSKGEIDILVGTQIITKGFDFDRLGLVGIIQADNILAQQNFRADERAIQLLEQFRGRSGRRGEKGLFVIQTREPEHPVFGEFTRDRTALMLQERLLFQYPPYTRLVHVIVRDTSEKRLDFFSRELASALSAKLPVQSVVGPYPPAPDRVADQYIRQIRIMLPRNKALVANKEALARTVAAFEKERKYMGHIVIDVDPA